MLVISIVALILSLASLVLYFALLRNVVTKRDLARLVGASPVQGQDLVARIEMVRPGDTQQQVKNLLSSADQTVDGVWIYKLDANSGYIVSFDSSGKVSTVNSWKS